MNVPRTVHFSQRFVAASTAVIFCCFLSGCSSLGLSLWPSNLPILNKARSFAKQSPLPSGLNYELSKVVVPDYFLEPGDRIVVEPVNLDGEFRSIGDQVVLVDGSIELGVFGRIRVSGMTVEQVENAIADQIEALGEKREIVNVQLIEAKAAKFYVLGAVGSPGAYPMDGNETVLDAILVAGGLTSKASACDILMVRPTDDCECRVVQRVCYRQITQLGDTLSNYQLQPGDRIVVGERTFAEEIAFWRQARGCECCDRSRCVQCAPASEQYSNRFMQLVHRLPWPLTPAARGEVDQVSEEDGGQGFARGLPGEASNASSQPESSGATDEQDFFLPPLGDAKVRVSPDLPLP